MTALRIAAACVLAVAAATAAFAGDVLTEWQSRYKKDAYASEKLKVAEELVATGKVDALKALQQCTVISKAAVEDFRKDAEKLRGKLAPVEAKLVEKIEKYFEQQRKQGNNDNRRPKFPEDDEYQQLRSELDAADRRIASEIAVLGDVLDAHGRLVGKLPPDAQKAVRDDWTKNRLSSKDWGIRAEGYELLGHTQTDWATEMLVAVVLRVREPEQADKEPDPRALVIAIDGLAKRDPAKVTPALVSRIDAGPWLVRVAVVTALELTPSKEGIDAIVKRMVKEDGRLKADCARTLTALTGQELPANPEMWRIWWEANRDKWEGKPPPKDEKVDPMGNIGKADDAAAKQTGFFGIAVESRRVVFVIDISGSMAAEMGGSGPDAKKSRAEAAKAELSRVVGALEDGALFNMVFFSTAVKVWKPDMQKADAKTRKEAQDYIAALQIGGGTNTYDALEAAFGLGDMGKGKKKESDPTGDARVDTIVFLSDGKPTQGRTTDPDAIRTAVREWNKSRRIAVHTVAFGAIKKEGEDGADPQFMKALADDTGGKAVVK